MIAHLSHVMTLANSIIGVSVLAMPFCFKQCGILLAVFVLLTSSVLSRLASHFLIKSAVMSRRRNFEFLAFHAFGTTGKLLVELFIIGFLLGTCIAFFVVVGDLGPQIVAKMLNKRPEDIRTSVLVTTGAFIVLPLGLLRNIDSLSSVCTATIGFYLCLVLKVICESTRHILLGDWYGSVIYWRPAGILQCLPIFSMALFCQTQLFEIYEAIPNVCLEKMNQVVRGALNICTGVYLCVGFFGYVAFCNQPFTGNILMSFEPSLTSDVIKMGFVFSVAFSFPLVIFPCRASLNSLLFRRAHGHEPANNYIPEVRFRWLTLAIVSLSLGTGILTPNIEFLLGIVGSTIGVMICLIFPAAFFIAISTKNTNERLIAQAILFLGVWIMILGTYANIYAMEESSNARVFITTGKPILDQLNDISFDKILIKEDFPINGLNLHPVKDNPATGKNNIDNAVPEIAAAGNAPAIIALEMTIASANKRSSLKTKKSEGGPPLSAKMGANDEKKAGEGSEGMTREESAMKNSKGDAEKRVVDTIIDAAMVKDAESTNEKNPSRNDNLIDSDAIRKEETELAAAAGEAMDLEAEARREKLRRTLEQHKLEQLKMMEEQKKLLKGLEEQKELLKDIKERKELLKDIKEQKEQFELEKKRMERRKNEERVIPEAEIPRKPEVVRKRPVGAAELSTVGEKQTRARERRIDVDGPSSKIEAKIADSRSRGPILSALANWTSLRNELEKNQPSEPSSPSNETGTNVIDETAKKTIDARSPLPLIALRMVDKIGKLSPISTKSPIFSSPNKTIDEANDNAAIGRDILEHRDVNREKRQIAVTRADRSEDTRDRRPSTEKEKILVREDVERVADRCAVPANGDSIVAESSIEKTTRPSAETVRSDVDRKNVAYATIRPLDRVVARENSSVMKIRDLKEAKTEA